MSNAHPEPQGPFPHGRRIPRGIVGNYTQVNILFPSEQVELPSAEKFKAFPPEAQKVILAAFEREQIERHGWLKNQQGYEYRLNMEYNHEHFVLRLTGTITASILALALLLVGAWLVRSGSSSVGVAAIIAAVGGVVGTAVYGRRHSQSTPQPKSEPAESKPEESEVRN